MGDRATVYMLRTTDAEGRSYGGFCWPREVGAVVTAQDWSPEPVCGHGLHGLLWGEGDVALLSDLPDALWWVVEADAASVVDLGGKVKAPRVTVRLVGTREDAVAWLTAHAPGHATCYARVTAGHEGMLAIRRWDGRRYRLVVGYVGENGIEAGVPYRLDADGRFVRAEAQR